MPFTGNTYALPSGNPVVTGTRIESAWANTTLSDISTALNAVTAGTVTTPSTASDYTPAGTGAVDTDVQTKLREVPSVKDFGATGDGVTDDAATFVLADALGGFILVPSGTYLLGTTVNINYGTTLLVAPQAFISGTLYEEGGRVIYLDNDAAPLMFDNFKSNGALVGRTPTVGANTWVTGGAGVATTSSGELIGNGTNVYCIQDMDSTPWEVTGVFEASNSTFSATIAFVRDYPGDAFDDMWHVSFNVTAGTGAIRGSYWKNAATDQTPQMTAAPSTVSVSISTKYRMRVIVDGKWCYATIESTAGNVLYAAAFYDDEIPNVVGPYVFWQINTGPVIKWHEVSARAKPTHNDRDFAKYRGGIDDTPIGLNNPSIIHATAVHVGEGQRPRGERFSVYNDSDSQSVFYSNDTPRVRIKAASNGYGQSLDFEQFSGAVSRVYSSGNANDIRIETNSTDRIVFPYSGVPYFSADYILMDGSSGNMVRGNKVSADKGDAAVTWTWNTDEPTLYFNTPLTANRAVGLSGTPINGMRLRVVRSAAATGGSTVDVGTGPLKSLAAGQWCEVDYNGSAWILTAFGSL